jgi:signal transduction histidine kinase
MTTDPPPRSGPTLEEAGSGGGQPTVALGVLVASLALAVVGIALTFVVRPAWDVNQWFFAVDTVDAVVYGVVAWLVLSRLRHPVSWILGVTAIGGGLAAVGAQWSLVWVEHPDLPALGLLQLAQSLTWVPGTLALIVILPWLLRRDPFGPGAKVALVLGALLIAWTTFVRLTDPFAGFGDEPLSPFAIESEAWTEFALDATQWENAALVVLGLVATIDVLRRRTRGPIEDRRALGWLAVAVGALSISFLPLALPASVADELPIAFTPLTHLVSQALYPAAVLGVVLRQRHWGVDLGVRRTLTWWLLTSGLVVTYVAAVAWLGALLPGSDGVVRVLATALIAAGFQPARSWVQRNVDALVHGDAGQPGKLVRQVGATLGTASHPAELLEGMVVGLAESLRLGGARIEVPSGDGTARLLAGVGMVGDRGIVVPLVHQQVEVARLVVAPRPNERLDGRSLESLEGVAPVVAATVALSTTATELEASRARLAEARDEERRVLRRELHDGLGPALAGVGLGLQASRNLLERDPTGARNLLETLSVELDARVEEVRGLARGLLPPSLEELGLVPAIVELAERHRTSGLVVELDIGELPPVTPTVATAVYGIVSEAVRNVHRHAEASQCRIDLADDDGLRIRIADDGVGIRPDAIVGVGTRSMRERAEGIGGTVVVRPNEPCGTEVLVHVPTPALQAVPS